jgi:ABC-type Fe3+/spermidine/putrescine transport system ATPase subunit
LSALLDISGLTVHQGGRAVLRGLDLTMAAGELFVLLGASGSGKSTLLRAIGGFLRPEAGRIALDGVDLAPLPAHLRPVNTMFQSYALFPHLSVAANIGFGPRRRGLSRARTRQIVAAMMRLTRLEGLEARYPTQLSGGQSQRVALARALAAEPRLLLLDEPLSALDRALRAETRAELRRLNRETGTGFILVTHDQEEALAMADRIGVLHDGALAQLAPPETLYTRPASRFVAGFMGVENILSGAAGPAGFTVKELGVTLPGMPHGTTHVALRAENLRIGGGPCTVEVAISARDYAGDSVILTGLTTDGAVLRARPRLGDGAIPAVGDSVVFGFAPDACAPLAS